MGQIVNILPLTSLRTGHNERMMIEVRCFTRPSQNSLTKIACCTLTVDIIVSQLWPRKQGMDAPSLRLFIMVRRLLQRLQNISSPIASWSNQFPLSSTQGSAGPPAGGDWSLWWWGWNVARPSRSDNACDIILTDAIISDGRYSQNVDPPFQVCIKWVPCRLFRVFTRQITPTDEWLGEKQKLLNICHHSGVIRISCFSCNTHPCAQWFN